MFRLAVQVVDIIGVRRTTNISTVHEPLDLILGALLGAVLGWAAFAGLFIRYITYWRDNRIIARLEGPSDQVDYLRKSRSIGSTVPKWFWRASPLAAVIGALIGLAIVVL